MDEAITTYRAKGKEIGLVFLFKYDLQGNLKQFEIAEGELNEQQIKWLFSSHFPSSEIIMKTVWMKDKKYLKVFYRKGAKDAKVNSVDFCFSHF